MSDMARYMDADKLLEKLPDDLPYKASVKRVLTQAQEDDVVPKSEVAREYGNALQTAFNDGRLEGGKEFAREIFGEIDAMIFGTIIPNDCAIISIAKLAELKKKYTDDKECPMCKHFAGCEQACGGMVCDEYEVIQT